MIERARAALAAARAEGVADEDVVRYFARKARWFPSDPDSEDPRTWEQRAEDLAYWEA